MGNYSSGYITKLDEIDKWLFDSFGILPGCCSSQENLRHTTARMVAEVLWPKKDLALTWEDVKKIEDLCMEVATLFAMVGRNKVILEPPFYEEVLRRFIEKREKKGRKG